MEPRGSQKNQTTPLSSSAVILERVLKKISYSMEGQFYFK